MLDYQDDTLIVVGRSRGTQILGCRAHRGATLGGFDVRVGFPFVHSKYPLALRLDLSSEFRQLTAEATIVAAAYWAWDGTDANRFVGHRKIGRVPAGARCATQIRIRTGHYSGVLPGHRGNGLQLRFLRARERKGRKIGWTMLISESTDTIYSANNLFGQGTSYSSHANVGHSRIDGKFCERSERRQPQQQCKGDHGGMVAMLSLRGHCGSSGLHYGNDMHYIATRLRREGLSGSPSTSSAASYQRGSPRNWLPRSHPSILDPVTEKAELVGPLRPI